MIKQIIEKFNKGGFLESHEVQALIDEVERLRKELSK